MTSIFTLYEKLMWIGAIALLAVVTLTGCGEQRGVKQFRTYASYHDYQEFVRVNQ